MPMLEAYGMTEASHEMAANPLPPARRVLGSVGVPTGTEIDIVDDAGASLPPGQPGEVVIRGPGVMAGYVGDPDANARAFFGEWFRTGDQGVLEDGYLRLVGRLKEIIIRGGENISPLEVEDVLLDHPGVAQAVVYGIPDDRYGQVVGAAVVLDDPALDEEALRAPLPRAARRVQGARRRPRRGRHPAHAHRQGAAPAHGRSTSGRPDARRHRRRRRHRRLPGRGPRVAAARTSC